MSMTDNHLSTAALKQCLGLCKFYRKGKTKKKKELAQTKNN